MCLVCGSRFERTRPCPLYRGLVTARCLTRATPQQTLHSSLNAVRTPTSTRTILANSATDRVHMVLASTLASVDEAENAAELFAERHGFDEDTRGSIAMAVREAVVNAVLHGNAYSREKQVDVSLEMQQEDLLVRVSDQGQGLNPDILPDPLKPENILRGSGRGIFLIRAFMDEVNFRQLNPGTELTLIKHRTPAEPGAKENAS